MGRYDRGQCVKPDGKESHEACQKKSRKRGKLRLTRHPDLVRHTHRHRAAGAHVPVRLLRDSVRLHAEHHRTGRPGHHQQTHPQSLQAPARRRGGLQGPRPLAAAGEQRPIRRRLPHQTTYRPAR
ncbi:hypothetical protein BAD_0233 [Bifidobacterium adolescentis ATCC 15703]|uniref:Uncharacterized protein n=1 Tax=Bifidobacterium adolescentis (strain ATCC 15703 / DSM 20083 / NCTC 11814 / E194a) TaxID=367928 RepID=A0ZZY1_BIFAA|nr:hypothetical protein BAD_0233 [Bifidobacterium adolescentis ATCC 15703]